MVAGCSFLAPLIRNERPDPSNSLSIDFILQKARFWHKHGQDGLKPEQFKVLNRLLDAGPAGFEGELSAAKYKGVAKVSKATATRHIRQELYYHARRRRAQHSLRH